MDSKAGIQKYTQCLNVLENNEPSSPDLIARQVIEKKRDPELAKRKDIRQKKQRIKPALERWTRMHQFPAQGNPPILAMGAATAAAWNGKRWQELMP